MNRRFFLALAFSVVAVQLGHVFALDKSGNFQSKQEQDEFIAATLKETARELNAQTPIQLDEETKLMSVIALKKTITFNVRLPRYKASDVDPFALSQAAQENLNATACKNRSTRYLIDLGVEYVYLYSGSDGKLITRVVVRSYQC